MGVLVAMVAITLLAIVVVTIKVVIFQPTVTAHLAHGFHSHSQEKDQLVAFEPLEQQQESEMKYTGFGFIPCNG